MGEPVRERVDEHAPLRLDTAAQFAGVDSKWLHRMAGKGVLTHYSIAGKLFTTLADIRAAEKAALETGHRGEIYIVGFGPYVKIGFSTSASARISGLQTGAPEPLITYAVFPGTTGGEESLHRRFAAYRLSGEWFRLEGDLETFVKGACNG